ncbi:hypothetical protein [Paenibacillus chitinolyticus]
MPGSRETYHRNLFREDSDDDNEEECTVSRQTESGRQADTQAKAGPGAKGLTDTRGGEIRQSAFEDVTAGGKSADDTIPLKIFEDVSAHERIGLRADDSAADGEVDLDPSGAIQSKERQNVWS